MKNPIQASGISLIEVLVALLVTAIGMFGMVALQARAQQSQFETLQRSQAMLLVGNMVERMHANYVDRSCYDLGAGFIGTGTAAADIPACAGGTSAARVDADLLSWHNALLGTEVTIGGGASGGLIGARGCIRNVPPAAAGDPDRYQVMVSWQGQFPTFDPALAPDPLNCGNGLYGTNAQRRTLGMWVEFADLAAGA